MTKPKKATQAQINEAKRELKKLLKKQHPYLNFEIELIDNAPINHYENMTKQLKKQ